MTSLSFPETFSYRKFQDLALKVGVVMKGEALQGGYNTVIQARFDA
jgi:hypothetical protein